MVIFKDFFIYDSLSFFSVIKYKTFNSDVSISAPFKFENDRKYLYLIINFKSLYTKLVMNWSFEQSYKLRQLHFLFSQNCYFNYFIWTSIYNGQQNKKKTQIYRYVPIISKADYLYHTVDLFRRFIISYLLETYFSMSLTAIFKIHLL